MIHGCGYMEWGGMEWMTNRHTHTIGYKETSQAATQKQYLQKTASLNKRSCMTAHWVVCTFAKNNPSDLGSAACAVITAIANCRRLRRDPRSTQTVPSQWKRHALNTILNVARTNFSFCIMQQRRQAQLLQSASHWPLGGMLWATEPLGASGLCWRCPRPATGIYCTLAGYPLVGP